MKPRNIRKFRKINIRRICAMEQKDLRKIARMIGVSSVGLEREELLHLLLTVVSSAASGR